MQRHVEKETKCGNVRVQFRGLCGSDKQGTERGE